MNTRNLTHAWRAGFVLACLGTLLIAVGSTLAGAGVMCAVAWLAGAATNGAHRAYRQRLELERRMEAAQARAAELARLEAQLSSAADDTERVRLLERLAGFECWPLVLALALSACAGGDLGELELEHDAGAPDAAAELGELELEPDAAAAADVDWLALVHPHCVGAWADRDDSSTRFTEHPETGLCTFACRWLEPKCDEPWYGDPRCFPAHELRLEQVCGELGGTCELAGDGERYCEAQP